MKLLADESLDFGIVRELRKDGHTVISILEENPSWDDYSVLKRALVTSSLILTEDKDFGELTMRFKMEHHGIMLIRAHDLSLFDRVELIRTLISDHGDRLHQCITVIGSADCIRIRVVS